MDEESQSVNQSGSGRKIIFFIAIIIIIAGISYTILNKRDISVDTSVTSTPIIERPGSVKLGSSTFGPLLTATSGRALYYFSNDSKGTTTCYGACALTWPPYMATDGLRVDASATDEGKATGTLSILTRADGSQQITYTGWPLYLYKEDVTVNDVKGHGVNKIWAIARPNGAFDLSTSTPVSLSQSVDPNAKVFNLTGSLFSFSTKEIRVKKGETITINYESTESLNDWVLDEFYVKTEQVRPGTRTSVTFVADKTGTFEYYSSVGQHRQLGMVGKLIVE